ncbi:phosphatidylserine decarboxylase [Gordoniibacillus kamchatkensis]|uniref:Phosphatidylserine decarboxylase proenzyme n=1 Tax=Gordoniibacillus kamchatkensis TaxID=1590651 RepID=A0ABR5ALC7_9BACL|nr:archaetidylserine decarboxylase [Paenibacillus sp. VKM B-2647]KIL41821.1 phosphatidylserine decarboxylase [Paenibacillus sp. VKM B-2647]
MSDRHFLRLLTELTSHKWLSRLVGALTKSRVSRILIPWYSRTYAIQIQEAEKPLRDYRTLNDFFIRRLKEGLRPVHPDASSLVSPVDGTVTGIGRIHDDLAITVKGQDYNVWEILNQEQVSDTYRGGFFIVLYLSPADYHRVHSPVAGSIVGKAHSPGKVYPVNGFGLRHMRKVLSRNERLLTYIRHRYGTLAVVKVGAMNVSSVQYAEGLRDRIAKGAELAYFEFGSTVVLLTENASFAFRDDLAVGSRVRVGEPIGFWGDIREDEEDRG